MARFSKLLSDGDFATGVTFYENIFPGDSEDKVRLVIYVLVGENLTPFIVDTGAPWCVLDPKIARSLIVNKQAGHIENIAYWVRHTRYQGSLYRLNLAFVDEPTGN